MRAAIYARYSSDNQREASIDDQIRLCEERAAEEGWQVVQTYSDYGLSGASMMRPGIQALMADALAGKFESILAEALDRLSRDQEDIAGIYKRLEFAGVKIVTLSEGDISHLHIGLKGTMNALYLKDLADKTRRGMRGRVEAGKAGGSNSYGYDVVRTIGDNGEPVRGERRINEREAAIVCRIFTEYASGRSPKTIARELNRDKVPSPAGKGWGPSTIHGNWQRGTGILNNELYIGKLVWNRMRMVKDPETGKRLPRVNPSSAWVRTDVPALRILDQDIWERVKARQESLRSHRRQRHDGGFWDRRRPRYLFSGLLRCGACGSAFVKYNTERFACTAARMKGTCDNRLTIRRDVLEVTVLEGLQHRLMDPALLTVFCEEYTRHMNRLRMEHNAAREGRNAELGRITRELDRLIQAIADGVPGNQVKDRIGELETRKSELKAALGESEEEPVLLHPNMAAYYRKQVEQLREALNDDAYRAEATGLIRQLVERIILTPETAADGRQSLSIDLHGELAGILNLAAGGKKAALLSAEGLEQIKLVAGEGLEPPTRGL